MLILPDWLDKETWQAFLQMRKQIKAPLTDYGQKLILNKLQQFEDWGYSANEALETSIERSWRGVFQPDQKKQREPMALYQTSPENQAKFAKLDEYYHRKHTKDYLRDEQGRPYLISPTSGERVYQDGRPA